MKKIQSVEKEIFDREGFVAIFRSNQNKLVPTYSFAKAAPGSWSVSDFIQKRLKSRYPLENFEIFNGNVESAHGRTKLSNVRKSYQKER